MATARDIMNTKVRMVPITLTVTEAIHTMNEKKVNALLVDKANPSDTWGIVTMGDIVHKVISKGLSPDKVHVNEIMTKPLIFVLPQVKLKHVARLFAQRDIERAPVIDNGEIVGMVSVKDLLADLALLES